MAIIHCYVDDKTIGILLKVSERTGRDVTELAESAISEEALRALREDESLRPAESK